MKLLAKVAFLLSLLACLSAPALGAAEEATGKAVSRADAYYNFAMGHLYAELASLYGNRGEYLTKAIDYYKQAIKADPAASFLSEELASLYIQAGDVNRAVSEMEERLKKDPQAVDARRTLGRIYSRFIGDPQQSRINETMLRKAIEQYQKIVEIEPKDVDSWLFLGRLQKVAQDSLESEKAYKKALELDPASEEAMTGLAMVYSDLGDNQRAIGLLKQAADSNPSARSLTTLAQAYESMRDYPSASQVLRRALELEPSNLDLKRALAQDLLFANKLDEAIKTYMEVTTADPKDAESYLRLSQVYRQSRDLAKSREALERAKQLEPDNLEIRYNEVSLLDAEGKRAEAVARMKELADSTQKTSYSPAERGNRAALLERLAILYRSNEQFPQAIDTFRKLAELDPEAGPRAATQVLETLRQAKEYARAAEEAETAHKKYPDDRTLAMVRASILAETGKTDLAVAEGKRLLNGDKDREGWLALAQIYEKIKDYREMGKALEVVDKLSATDDDKGTVYFMRGAMYERMKDYQAAETEFRKALSLDADNASVLNYLGYMLADRNQRLEEAHKMISRALELDPYNGAYLDSLGWVYYRTGKLEEAEANLRRAIQRVSRDPTVHDHLGDILAKRGKLKEAIAEWQVSLKEWEASSQSDKDPAEVAKTNKKLEGAKVRLAKESPSRTRKP